MEYNPAMRKMLIITLLLLPAVGCGPGDEPFAGQDSSLPALVVQQSRAYPETETGMFISLADFEDVPDGDAGHEQVKYFSIATRDEQGALKFAVNITRTGTGALEVSLPPRAVCVFRSPQMYDLTGYTLLSIAMYSESLRDDLRVTLVSASGNWSSGRCLIVPGWNNVLVDIQRLVAAKGFDVREVREIRVDFTDSVGYVTFNIDDIMLIDNTRKIANTPGGISLVKKGLDYELTRQVNGDHKKSTQTHKLLQGADGLWRWQRQPVLSLIAADDSPSASKPAGEKIAALGTRKVGRVEILECNPIRLRIANTWYFPTRSGEWSSLAIRQVRWEHTFYADGRCVTNMRLNNAGGRKITDVGLSLDEDVTWSDGATGRGQLESGFAGPVIQWSYLSTSNGLLAEAHTREYANPAKCSLEMGTRGDFAGGDRDRNQFDESRGSYTVAASSNGHCRFTLTPPAGGIANPVIHVKGKWGKKVSANAAGMSLHGLVRFDDGSVLLVIPGQVTRPTRIEVTGDQKE